MPTGRCAGCGFTNSERKTRQHVIACDAFLVLFRDQPARALDPLLEFARYQSEEQTADARALRRDVARTERFSELSTLQDLQTRRWARTRDILED